MRSGLTLALILAVSLIYIKESKNIVTESILQDGGYNNDKKGCPDTVHPDVKGFGPNCRYRCNCKNNEQCDEVTGKCPTGCLHGWMGPGCQYRNYATMLAEENVRQNYDTHIESDYSRVAIDGDVNTCSRTGDIQRPRQSQQQWWRAEFNSSLYIVGLVIRIPLSEKDTFRGFSVEIGNSTDNLDLCYTHGADVTGEVTMDVNCVTPLVGEVLEIKLAENETSPLVLCEIEIFGGRLISFHRRTEAKSIFDLNGPWNSSYAVDGRPMAKAFNNNQHVQKDRTCTRNQKYTDSSTFWDVIFGNVYNIQGISFFGFSSHGNTRHFSSYLVVTRGTGSSMRHIFTDDPSKDAHDYYPKSKNYTIPIPSHFAGVRKRSGDLGICEFEVFGDCPLGNCGWECNVTCMCRSQTTGKPKIKGTCPYGCSGRWSGLGGMCNIECSDTEWGPYCKQTCGHCKNNMTCSVNNGTCPGSCEPGWKPPFCVDALQCPNDTDNYGIAWDRGIQGQYMRHQCPEGYKSGWVKRFCDESGTFHEPIYNCTQAAIEDIYRKLSNESTYINGTTDILDELVNATSVDNTDVHILMIGDIEMVNEILTKITDIVEVNSTDINKVTDRIAEPRLISRGFSPNRLPSFVEVVNNMFEEDTKITWKILVNETGFGADEVIDTLDRFIEKIATGNGANSTTAVFAKSNLLMKLDTFAQCEITYHFPDRQHDVIPAWVKDTADNIGIPCTHENGKKSYSSVMYRDLSEILPSRTSENRTARRINAPVISFTFFPKITGELERPVEITFGLFDTTMENPICTYWKRNNDISVGYWSDDGCWLSKYDKKKNIVVCKCNHLTNFALLMMTTSIRENSHAVILSVITMTGCITSMICLVLTLFTYVIFWKNVKSFTAIININLVLALFMAYLIFLTGIDKTQNKVICTSIAVLLHFVYLVVFFIMLTEGLCLAYSVYKPFSTNRPVKPLLIASYVLPSIIVGISMVVVKLDGYGNKKFCWLSTDSGLIWAFAIPVLTIISVNLVIIGLVIRKLCGTVAMIRKTDSERAKAGIRSVLVLMPITGVTWVFGIFSVNEDTVIFQYLFAIFNSLQGVLIFVFQCLMNKQIQTALSRALGKSKKQSSQTPETQKGSTELKVSQPVDISSK